MQNFQLIFKNNMKYEIFFLDLIFVNKISPLNTQKRIHVSPWIRYKIEKYYTNKKSTNKMLEGCRVVVVFCLVFLLTETGMILNYEHKRCSKLNWYQKFYNPVILFFGTKTLRVFNWLIPNIILIIKRDTFVYHHWSFTLIFRLMPYFLRFLVDKNPQSKVVQPNAIVWKRFFFAALFMMVPS